MIIKKHIERKTKIDYFLIEGVIDVDSNYFIDSMKKGFDSPRNQNFKTNIQGFMTPWNYFLNDEKFMLIIEEFIKYVDSTIDLTNYNIFEAWGFSSTKNQRTEYHNHLPSTWSGVLYLNDCNSFLNFKDINKKVYMKKGKFVLFSSFLEHGTDFIETDETKWGISFNFGPVL